MTSGAMAHSSVARLDADAITSRGFHFRSWYALRDGRCPVRVLKVMNGAPTSRSIRSSGVKHGRAYNTRVSRSRTSRSTQLDGCNGLTRADRNVCRWLVDHRPGDPVRGRAGEGEEVIRCPATVRYARCGTPKQDWSSFVVTGERPEIERLMGSFGGGSLEKYPDGQLADGLPYGTHGFEAEVEGAIYSSTVTDSTWTSASAWRRWAVGSTPCVRARTASASS
jgi:hypothetical protein